MKTHILPPPPVPYFPFVRNKFENLLLAPSLIIILEKEILVSILKHVYLRIQFATPIPPW